MDTYKRLLGLLFFTILLNLLVWSIFKFQSAIPTLFANYDGPNYLAIAKCGYSPSCLRQNFSLPQTLEYYPAHLPAFPLLIRIINLFINGPWAMLFATLLGNLFLTFYFLKYITLYQPPKRSFYLSLLFLIFPGRFFVTKLVGAPESWFVGLLLASIYHYKKNEFLPSAMFLALAEATKTPAVILLLAFTVHSVINRKIKNIIPHWILVSSVLLVIFSLYKVQTGDFLAYFHSGDNRHLSIIPYQVFLSNQTWVQSIWLEEILYIFMLSILAVYRLYKKYKLDISTIFASLFFLAIIFVGHRDISRYASPIYPFLYLAFAPILGHKYAKVIFLLLLPAVILYAINFIFGNTAPIANWAPYL